MYTHRHLHDDTDWTSPQTYANLIGAGLNIFGQAKQAFAPEQQPQQPAPAPVPVITIPQVNPPMPSQSGFKLTTEEMLMAAGGLGLVLLLLSKKRK
jgi:hypothetical protein